MIDFPRASGLRRCVSRHSFDLTHLKHLHGIVLRHIIISDGPYTVFLSGFVLLDSFLGSLFISDIAACNGRKWREG